MTTDNLDEPMKQGKAANQLQPGYEPASLKTLVRIVKLSKNKQQLLQPRQGSQASSQAAVSSNSLWTKYNNHNLILKSALHHLLCFLHVWVSFFLHWATSVGIPPFRGGGVSQGMCTTLGVCMLAWSFPCQGGESHAFSSDCPRPIVFKTKKHGFLNCAWLCLAWLCLAWLELAWLRCAGPSCAHYCPAGQIFPGLRFACIRAPLFIKPKFY